MTTTETSLNTSLRAGCDGTIQKRQSTYWDISLYVDQRIESFRVHFRHKCEQKFVATEFSGGGIFVEHPLLRNVLEPAGKIYLASAIGDSSRVLADIRVAVAGWSNGWRVAEEYLNGLAWPEDVVESGYGLLLEAPNTLAAECVEILRKHNVEYSTLPSRAAAADGYAVLVCGRSFVVAESFKVEQTDN